MIKRSSLIIGENERLQTKQFLLVFEKDRRDDYFDKMIEWVRKEHRLRSDGIQVHVEKFEFQGIREKYCAKMDQQLR